MPQRPATACVSTPGDRVGVQAVDGVLQSAAAVLASRMAPDAGLSPRERGNHRRPTGGGDGHGSIPARAGEPNPTSASWPARRVYPRASGGTTDEHGDVAHDDGLSPRERGNPELYRPLRRQPRSIPARAGEPAGTFRSLGTATVYPRASGGTSDCGGPLIWRHGLSPRERGNPLRNISLQRGAAGPQRTSMPNPARGRLLAPRLCARLAPHQIYAVGIHNCLGSLAECAYSLFPYRCGISPGHHN